MSALMTPEIREQIRSRIASGTAEMWDAAVLWQHLEAAEKRAAEEAAQFINRTELQLTYETNKDGRGRPAEWHTKEHEWGGKAKRAVEMLADPEHYRNVAFVSRVVAEKVTEWREVKDLAAEKQREDAEQEKYMAEYHKSRAVIDAARNEAL